jgi:predicted NBD/HSP70 family sugar kinase
MRLPTEQVHGYEHILKQIRKLLDTMSAETGLKPQKIGIGTPGTLDPGTQTLKNSNTICLNGMPFKKDLEAEIKIPVSIANDANCFALAETRLGIVHEKMPEASVIWGIIMGTGVGSGIVANGKLIEGKHGIGGEWGHNFLDESGGKCYCGKIGCVETILSGPALAKFYNIKTGKSLKLPVISELAMKGVDEIAMETMNRQIHFFGKAVANVINIIDPDAIVLGGGLGKIERLYTDGVREVVPHLFNDKLETPFLKPKLGDSAGVFGAALLTA